MRFRNIRFILIKCHAIHTIPNVFIHSNERADFAFADKRFNPRLNLFFFIRGTNDVTTITADDDVKSLKLIGALAIANSV